MDWDTLIAELEFEVQEVQHENEALNFHDTEFLEKTLARLESAKSARAAGCTLDQWEAREALRRLQLDEADVLRPSEAVLEDLHARAEGREPPESPLEDGLEAPAPYEESKTWSEVRWELSLCKTPGEMAIALWRALAYNVSIWRRDRGFAQR